MLFFFQSFLYYGCNNNQTNTVKKAKINSDIKYINPAWEKAKFYKASVCCDTEPTSTVSGAAITILPQNKDGELSFNGNSKTLKDSKLITFDILLAADTKIESNSFVNTDFRFGLMKPEGIKAQIMFMVNGVTKQLIYDRNTAKNGTETFSISIPATNMDRKLPIQIHLTLERSDSDSEALLQFDSIDTCIANSNSKVCISANQQH